MATVDYLLAYLKEVARTYGREEADNQARNWLRDALSAEEKVRAAAQWFK